MNAAEYYQGTTFEPFYGLHSPPPQFLFDFRVACFVTSSYDTGRISWNAVSLDTLPDVIDR